jgi:hypothetical protein
VTTHSPPDIWFSMVSNDLYVKSRRLRASFLSIHMKVEAGYNPLIYY